MIRNTYLRRLLGTFLGGLAGVSFCLSILPVAIQMIGAGDETTVAFRLSPYLIYTALVWAAGGWAVTRTAVPLAGAVTLAVVGVVTGILLAWFGLAHEVKLLAAGAATGLIYGFLGGLILGRVAGTPIPGQEDAP